MAVIIDGKKLAKKTRENLKIECSNLKEKNINNIIYNYHNYRCYFPCKCI